MTDDNLDAAQTEADVQNEIAEVRRELQTYLDNNKTSSIQGALSKKGLVRTRVMRPWGDLSLAINIPKDRTKLVDALNTLHLPRRLSAIYHLDRKSLEVIYTALKVSDGDRNRSFRFEFRGNSHVCEFALSSERLLSIAANTVPQSASQTNLRNLQSFALYTRAPERDRGMLSLDCPLSFWIHNVEWHEEEIFELISSLNFHMMYYDYETPIVLVHNISEATEKTVDRSRFIHGSFPDVIKARDLDQNLLSFWNATHNSNELLSFILYYRIIEYAQFHYVESSVKREMTRIIKSPHFASDISKGIEKLAETFQTKGLEEIQKFRMTIKNNCDPALLWAEISRSRTFFEEETKFEGGFTAKPLITKKDDEDAFRVSGMERFTESIRKIRNTLSHGKDQETAGVITPTLRNFELLRPWVNLISIAAGEVLLYKDVI